MTVAASATLGVLLREPDGYLAQLTEARRRIAEANRRRFDTPPWLAADGPPDGEDFVKLVLDYRECWAVAHGCARRREPTPSELPPVLTNQVAGRSSL